MNPTRRERAILHVDMDAFFVSVELLQRPDLAHRQVIVGRPGERSVVLSASYDCRALGVRSAMPMTTAVRLAPRAVVIEPSQGKYREVSARIMGIFREITPLVQPLSVDEAFLDVTGSMRRLGAPGVIGEHIRDRIRSELSLPASVGAAKNMFVAKIASQRAKPDGLLVIRPEQTVEFLHTLPVSALWGVGRRTAEVLANAGIHSVRDIAQSPLPMLQRMLGAQGKHLYSLAWGRDEREVVTERNEKSIGSEETFAQDERDPSALRVELLRLSHGVAARLRASGKLASSVSLKVRYADFTTVSRSRRLQHPSASAVTLADAATSLFDALWRPGDAIRLIGVRTEQLVSSESVQFSFDRADANWDRAEAAMDRIRDKFQGAGLSPASLLPRESTEREDGT